VVVLEGTDARNLDAGTIEGRGGAIVADVSFISLTEGAAGGTSACRASCLARRPGQAANQAGREAVGKGGIVRNAEPRAKAVAEVRAFIDAQPGWKVFAEMPSPILGGSGNEEVLIRAHH
jgi:23S rRNA (cytidine1920-2'-O)/16S rRNA (cytidine1409-2'-O)-methyltransferase